MDTYVLLTTSYDKVVCKRMTHFLCQYSITNTVILFFAILCIEFHTRIICKKTCNETRIAAAVVVVIFSKV